MSLSLCSHKYLYQFLEEVSLRCINQMEKDFPKWALDQAAKLRKN